jgi:hypothetical protein
MFIVIDKLVFTFVTLFLNNFLNYLGRTKTGTPRFGNVNLKPAL